uniref:THAP-type domain-containing protein n=1 Tax=Fundulus heteroclitus TaxID=8078 RepID=A0A3Q2ULV5_FUNHE
MPTTCCAPGCTQRHSRSSDVRFCRLPKDKEKGKKWIISMKRTQADNPNRLLHFITGRYNLILSKRLFHNNIRTVHVQCMQTLWHESVKRINKTKTPK